MKKYYLVGTAVLALWGCGELSSLGRPYTEPADGSIASIRVITNGYVRFVPGHSCVDWSTPGVGLVASAMPSTMKVPALNGQKIGVSGESPLKPGYQSAEVRARADAPLTVVFAAAQSDSFMRTWCEPVSVAFIPVAGEQYEIVGEMGTYCSVRIRSLTHAGQVPAQKRAEACK